MHVNFRGTTTVKCSQFLYKYTSGEILTNCKVGGLLVVSTNLGPINYFNTTGLELIDFRDIYGATDYYNTSEQGTAVFRITNSTVTFSWANKSNNAIFLMLSEIDF